MSKPIRIQKKVKAWAVMRSIKKTLVGKALHREYGYELTPHRVYLNRSVAFGERGVGDKIVPCTITYTLP